MTFKHALVLLCSFFILSPSFAQARSSKPMTLGLIVMGNIQLIDTTPQLDPGPGGGIYFDYRFNQRYSITVDGWATFHDGTGASSNDNSIKLLGVPTATIKFYLSDNEESRFDPYAGMGLGLYALTEGSSGNGTGGFGLGGKIDVGFDYYLSNAFSLGFTGSFHSIGLITSLGDNSNSIAMIPFSLMGKLGFHF